MKFFKPVRRIQMVLLVMAGLQLLTGCFKPESRLNDEELAKTATFYADEVKGRSEVSELVPGFSIPQSKLYSFTVCLRDRRTEEPIKAHSFSIKGGESVQSLRTNNNGCLVWSEKIQFEFLADEKYIPLERLVESEGTHKGARALRLAINPWLRSEASAEVLDLSRTNLPSEVIVKDEEAKGYLLGQGTTEQATEKSLWLSSLMIENKQKSQASPEKQGLERQLTLSFNSAILLRDLQLKEVPFDLKKANLKIDAMLISTVSIGGEEKKFAAGEMSSSVVVRREGDRFKADLPIRITHGNSNTSFQLALRVSPVNGPEAITAFEGLFEIGSYEQLLGSGVLRADLRTSSVPSGSGSEAFSFDQATKAVVAPESPMKDDSDAKSPSEPQLPSGVSQAQKFRVGFMEVALLGVVGRETATYRTMGVSITTCVTDSSTGGKPANDVDFTVTLANGKEKKVRTQALPGREGCLYWTDQISHQFYEAEHYILVPVEVKHQSGFVEKRVVALNPWDRFGIGRDMARDHEFVNGINSRPRQPSRLVMDGVRMETVEHRSYEVDQFLNLKTLKRVRFRIPMRVQRYSNILAGRGLPSEALRDGIYAVNSALHVVSQDPAGQVVEIVAPVRGGTRLVRIIGGELKVDNEFAIPDARLMAARASIVVELYPVKEEMLSEQQAKALNLSGAEIERVIDRKSALVSPPYAGPLWIKDETSFSTLIATDELAATAAGNPVKLQSNAESFRAIQYLAGVDIAKLTKKSLDSDRRYQARMAQEAKLDDVLKKLNVDYVPLNHSESFLKANSGLFANNLGLQATTGSEKILKYLNFQFPKRSSGVVPPYEKFQMREQWNEAILRNFVVGQREMDFSMASRLCLVFLHEMHSAMFPQGLTENAKVNKSWAYRCLDELGYALDNGQEPGSVFTVERKLRTVQMGPAKYKSARGLHFKVGADVGFSRSKQQYASWGYGWSPMGIIDTVLGMAGKTGGRLSLLSTGFNALGLSLDFKKGYNDSQSTGEGSVMAAGLELNMERLELDLRIEKYERCAIIRLNPEFWDRRVKGLTPAIRSDIDAMYLMRGLSRGIMLCTGEIEDKPMITTENYYTFGHGFVDETMMDRGDLRNQPWLIMLRGQRDYVNFVSFMEARKSDTSQVPEKINVGEVPLDRIQQAYTKYKLLTPSLPGFVNFDRNLVRPATTEARKYR